jgi:tRNA A37 threonylcarbamoyladenosine dehydratase
MKTFSRTQLLIGESALRKLNNARVAVFGIGGVGGHAMEALVRSGIGAVDLIDHDTVDETNLNRQIIATRDVIGRPKVEVAAERFLDINPQIKINAHKCFYLPEKNEEFDFSNYDYVIDAIDTVTGKIGLIMECQRLGVPIISSMGTGNKLDPTMLKISDIYKTSVCPLARVMRNELKKRGVKKLRVVYSEETPIIPQNEDRENDGQRRSTPASCSFVPSVAGLIIASEVVRDIVGK